MEMNLMGYLWSCILLSFFLAVCESSFMLEDTLEAPFQIDQFSSAESAQEGSVTKECRVGRHGKLTSFSGEQVQLTLPCKYALADFTCGNYRVKVTPGNGPTSEDFHSCPVTMWTKIVNTQTEEFIKLRTSLKHLEKYQQGKAENAFIVKEGWLGEIDVMGYDASLAALLLKKNDVFDVTFSEEGGVAVRCLVEEFTSDPVPDTWCGDAENTVAMQNGISELFGDISNATLETYVNYHILTDTTVTQSKTCTTLSAKFQSCAAKTEAVTKCDVITNDASTTQCLAQSDTPLETYYSDCVNSVCDGDASALDATNSYIMDNCNDEPSATPTPQTTTTQPPQTTATTTTTAKTTAEEPSTTTPPQTTTTLPPPTTTAVDPLCPGFEVLDDTKRDVRTGNLEKCDKNLTSGWYRFELDGTNAVMPTYCVRTERCGGIGTYWLDLRGKELPAVGQQTVARACCHYSIYCCLFKTPVTVFNCGPFYVYQLVPTLSCYENYCAERVAA